MTDSNLQNFIRQISGMRTALLARRASANENAFRLRSIYQFMIVHRTGIWEDAGPLELELSAIHSLAVEAEGDAEVAFDLDIALALSGRDIDAMLSRIEMGANLSAVGEALAMLHDRLRTNIEKVAALLGRGLGH